MKPEVHIVNIGLIPFQDAWTFQDRLHAELVEHKLRRREEALSDPHHYLVFCEHPHVYTLGKSGKENHLLVNEQFLTSKGAEFIKINRGGDITYHGPGQLVAYPILDLDYFFNDIHKYMRLLEETVIRVLDAYGIKAGRIEGWTGVWTNHTKKSEARKICAFGVRTSRWVTMHGLALNVNTDLSFFNHIVPCGLSNTNVTSMQQILNREISLEAVQEIMKNIFADVFDCSVVHSDMNSKHTIKHA
ncbi:MAG TPA: lipoyl(octanoyl) transferase LipB [Bacteroidia bacterium]|nr:lipoyl(octanoyl) transferase LipB [Bacteroidia bacterium]HNT79527.1 lipoyl(octanoyl) transferase LipB [Bacteroidia bacterium]